MRALLVLLVLLALSWSATAAAMVPPMVSATCERSRPASWGRLWTANDGPSAELVDATLRTKLEQSSDDAVVMASEAVPGLHLLGRMSFEELRLGLTRALPVVDGHLVLRKGAQVRVRPLSPPTFAVSPLEAPFSALEAVVGCDVVDFVEEPTVEPSLWDVRVRTAGLTFYDGPNGAPLVTLRTGKLWFERVSELDGWIHLRHEYHLLLDGWIRKEDFRHAYGSTVAMREVAPPPGGPPTHRTRRVAWVSTDRGATGHLDAGTRIRVFETVGKKARFLTEQRGLVPTLGEAFWVATDDLAPLP
ncbi:MAG: hypothetical protein IPJ34_14590 [Myxococcales bacterium]|nr:hypothetical protein [Myxococcales bacterium]